MTPAFVFYLMDTVEADDDGDEQALYSVDVYILWMSYWVAKTLVITVIIMICTHILSRHF